MNDIQCASATGFSSSKEVPVLARLKAQKEQLEKKLANINDAISQLESHPEIYGVLEALNKLGHY